MAKIIKFWLPVLFSMGFIFYGSSIPGTNIPSIIPSQNIIYHLGVFLVLAFFFKRALKNTSQLTSAKLIVFTLIFGIIYAFTDEFHQAFVPNRTVSGFDVFIDTLGVILGSSIYR